jgi:hypothetical protein
MTQAPLSNVPSRDCFRESRLEKPGLRWIAGGLLEFRVQKPKRTPLSPPPFPIFHSISQFAILNLLSLHPPLPDLSIAHPAFSRFIPCSIFDPTRDYATGATRRANIFPARNDTVVPIVAMSGDGDVPVGHRQFPAKPPYADLYHSARDDAENSVRAFILIVRQQPERARLCSFKEENETSEP